MKIILKLAQTLAITVAGFFGVLAFTVLFADGVIVDRFLDFLILISPVLLIVFSMIFFRRYYKILGMIYVGIGLIYFFFFRPYLNLSTRWPVIILFVMPLLVAGTIHFIYNDEEVSKEIS